MRRRPKVLAWGTFCPVCKTVRASPAALYLTCDGHGRAVFHESELVEVLHLVSR